MHISTQVLNLRRFVAKIKDENNASLNMFRGRLGYKQDSHCDYFKETTLSLEASLTPDRNDVNCGGYHQPHLECRPITFPSFWKAREEAEVREKFGTALEAYRSARSVCYQPATRN